jgi:hypothetical protein
MTDDELKEQLEDAFKGHEATLTHRTHGFTRVVWGKPDTMSGRMVFIRDGRRLIVTGDYGDATYAWSDYHDMEWIADTDLGYFKSKCQSSPVGRHFNDWDPDKAERLLRLWAKEYDQCGGPAAPILPKCEEVYMFDALSSKHEWISWCVQHADNLLGNDHWEWSQGVGDCVHYWCRVHHAGLKAAVKYLTGECK